MSKQCYVVTLNDDKKNPFVFESLELAKASVRLSWCNTSAVIDFKEFNNCRLVDACYITVDNITVGMIERNTLLTEVTHL